MKSGERFNDKREWKPENHLLFNENETMKMIIIIPTINRRKREQKYQNHLHDDTM